MIVRINKSAVKGQAPVTLEWKKKNKETIKRIYPVYHTAVSKPVALVV